MEFGVYALNLLCIWMKDAICFKNTLLMSNIIEEKAGRNYRPKHSEAETYYFFIYALTLPYS